MKGIMMRILHAVLALLWIFTATGYADTTSPLALKVKQFNQRVRATPISGTGTLHTTFQNKDAVEESLGKKGIRLSAAGVTSDTIESDHSFTFSLKDNYYFLHADNFVGRKGSTSTTQQANKNGTLTFKTARGKTVYSRSKKNEEPFMDVVMLFIDAYYKDVVFTLPDVTKSDGKITIKGEATETVYKDADQPSLLFKSLKNDGNLVWTREYSDHIKYRGVMLPQTMVQKLFSHGGQLFRTMTYKLTYLDKSELDERIDKTIELPKGANKGSLERRF